MRLIAALAVCIAGCGRADDGPARFDVSGKALFDGKPIPVGKILFSPDTTKGNDGPQGFADIKEGAFDTKLGGKGTVGGPHTVRIMGSDGKSLPGAPEGSPIFLEYTTPIDLPREATTKDFEVPKKAADGLPPGPFKPA